jgi:pantetheine-phosphate adenylyltransferase
MRRRAVYPGSFDPVHNGHLDIIDRASRSFEEVIVAVLENETKCNLFTVPERMALLRESIAPKNVRVESFHGLLADYMRALKARITIRGMRAVSDFEYEFQMALMNRHLYPEMETLFMVPAEEYTFLSSRLVKEVARLRGDVSRLVPPRVAGALKDKLR